MTTTEAPQDMSLHQMYKSASPYYNQILARWGRWLTYAQVMVILAEHGTNLGEYVVDGHATPPTSADTDAAELLAWLGY